ncbi:MAG: carboxypeptidase-like regulatory domain-containing protein [Vicinamibacterales bacterium]
MPRVTVPLDASGIAEFDPKYPVKVVVAAGGKPVASETVSLDKKGQGKASVNVDGDARGLSVAVGPADATDDEILGLQTLAVDIPLRRFRGKDEIVTPIRITPYYWFWWLRWCRTFTIRGRVLCPDGSPVPGAVVCAYDVDAWWWWWSKQLVGCATTDVAGAFSMTFRWCCGWWPWWWWRLRRWYVEPTLAKHILGALQREPRFPRIPLPDPPPDLSFFEALINEPSVLRAATASAPAGRAAVGRRVAAAAVDPSRLDALRERLVGILPTIPALQLVRLWPWWPWHPWWDCNPDIVFRATQFCGGVEHVIVNEGWLQAHWNIPQAYEVTLTATDDACCVGREGCLEGECLALAKVCSVDADEVGGNPGADPAPVGYAFPNVVAHGGDAPFAEVVDIRGTAQCLTNVDYYEIEFTADSGVTWSVVPPAGLGTFKREYWDFVLGTDVDVWFNATIPIDGHHVYETLEHYEATHTPADWGATKVWLATNFDMVFPWVTSPTFADGVYGLRVIGYDEAGGVLSNRRELPVCDSSTTAEIVVMVDNQSTYAAPGPPGNPCGPGTTHTCTDEPMTDIIDARIVHLVGPPTTVGPCGNVNLKAGDILEVDFVAYDAQGHLASYSLLATYGENEASDLIGLGGSLAPLPGGAPPVPAASQVGPDYAAARTLPQTAAAPTWTGGAIRLSISAAVAFPLSCCYQLELRAYKRTIVNCHANNAHRNLSERSFQVTI